ncbi:MAG: hypothetical protein H3C43_08985 [Leptonema sp. (in: Bacteria)]|nr:hypothetical protein [Leptonema sp. (in: bacteria)]
MALITTHQLPASIEKFIIGRRVLCFSTSANNVPYSAPVFYSFNSKLVEFYFLSDFDSTHSMQAVQNNHVSISIFDQNPTIKKIQGAQIQCIAESTPLNQMLNSDQLNQYKTNVPESIEQLNKADNSNKSKLAFWKLIAYQIKFTDNQIRFGYKEYWSRS